MGIERARLLRSTLDYLRRAVRPKLLIVLLVCAAAMCLGTLIYVQHENSSIVDRDMQTAVTLSEIAARFDHEDGNLYRLMVDEAARNHSSPVAERVAQIRARVAEISSDLAKERHRLSKEDQKRAAIVIAEIDKYNEAVGVVSSMLELDFATSVAMLHPFRENATQVLDEVRGIAASGITDAHRHAETAASRTRLLVAMVTIAVLIVAFLSYLWLALASQRGVQLQEEMKRRSDAEREALLLARTDVLTGLVNRRAFNAELQISIDASIDDSVRFAVLLLDLDNFKEANDLHGHAAGDAVLSEAADRLRHVFEPDSIIARLGGDEFAVLVRSGSDTEEILTRARHASALLHAPVAWRDNAIAVGASIGIARFPEDGLAADALLHAADVAMYQAKHSTKGGVHLFMPAMEAERQERRRLEEELKAGIDAGEFSPYYQPIVSLEDGTLSGYEALARWHHPRLGVLTPSTFLKLAEVTGLISDLTRSLLRQTCRDAYEMPGTPRFSINISPVQFGEPGLADALIAIVREEGVDPSRIEIEITEDAIMDDIVSAERAIDSFRSSGMTVALDDFGTGYSSLSHLQRLKFDKLKIDQSFVANLESSRECEKLVDAIIGLALSLDMKVTAEGIENAAAAALLACRGCTQGQGWFFGRPAPVERIVPHRNALNSWAA